MPTPIRASTPLDASSEKRIGDTPKGAAIGNMFWILDATRCCECE